jgi:hypothetical protein
MPQTSLKSSHSLEGPLRLKDRLYSKVGLMMAKDNVQQLLSGLFMATSCSSCFPGTSVFHPLS